MSILAATPEVPDLLGCDLTALAALGGRLVRVAEPVVFGTHIDQDLRLLRALQQATSRTVRLDWTCHGQPLLPLRDRVHLLAPSAAADRNDDVLAWQAGYRYGSFYYRVGPGFVTVKDTRPDGEHARMTVEGDSYASFMALTRTHRIDALDRVQTEALGDAVDLGLAVRGEAEFLLLPLHMRRWPVPYSAI